MPGGGADISEWLKIPCSKGSGVCPPPKTCDITLCWGNKDACVDGGVGENGNKFDMVGMSGDMPGAVELPIAPGKWLNKCAGEVELENIRLATS